VKVRNQPATLADARYFEKHPELQAGLCGTWWELEKHVGAGYGGL
jgi:hypothetical protein